MATNIPCSVLLPLKHGLKSAASVLFGGEGGTAVMLAHA
jgi:hypothetical protein